VAAAEAQRGTRRERRRIDGPLPFPSLLAPPRPEEDPEYDEPPDY
jgi:hypothetical protein